MHTACPDGGSCCVRRIEAGIAGALTPQDVAAPDAAMPYDMSPEAAEALHLARGLRGSLDDVEVALGLIELWTDLDNRPLVLMARNEQLAQEMHLRIQQLARPAVPGVPPTPPPVSR